MLFAAVALLRRLCDSCSDIGHRSHVSHLNGSFKLSSGGRSRFSLAAFNDFYSLREDTMKMLAGGMLRMAIEILKRRELKVESPEAKLGLTELSSTLPGEVDSRTTMVRYRAKGRDLAGRRRMWEEALELPKNTVAALGLKVSDVLSVEGVLDLITDTECGSELPHDVIHIGRFP